MLYICDIKQTQKLETMIEIANTSKKGRRSARNWKKRDAAKAVAKLPNKFDGMTIAEINRMNAEENLPSSMK